MKRKKLYIYIGIAVALIAAIIIYNSFRSKKVVEQKVKVQQGLFEIIVNTTGDLQAISSENINAPEEIRGRNVRFSDIKILWLIPEGTVVDSGQRVADLDPSTAQNTLKNSMDELEGLKNSYESTLLDTSLNLKGIRDNIASLKFALEEAEITMEQSIYEPPATQRQAKNNKDKALRSYEQEINRYGLKTEQELSKVRDIKLKLSRKQSEIDEMNDVISKFTIHAPKSGMVIYIKDYSGDKRKTGSSISPWDRAIATLPDLSTMLSKTYVNEIDISKVKVGQKVRVGVDAFPDKKYTGVITEVANVGEQLRNADAKVFEVRIKINESDPILRPSMTTSNQIITSVIDSVMYVPLEALHGDDTITYVYRANNTKQVVITGDVNDNYCIIEQGLKPGDELYLSTPEKAEKFKLVGEDLIPIIKERAEKKRLEEEERKKEAARQEETRRSRQTMMMGGGRGGNMMMGSNNGGGGNMRMGATTNGTAVLGTQTNTNSKDTTNRQRRQMDMSNMPKEVQEAMQKGDTAAVRKYFREQRQKQDGNTTTGQGTQQKGQQKQTQTTPQATEKK